jgi:hypothetical protein
MIADEEAKVREKGAVCLGSNAEARGRSLEVCMMRGSCDGVFVLGFAMRKVRVGSTDERGIYTQMEMATKLDSSKKQVRADTQLFIIPR